MPKAKFSNRSSAESFTSEDKTPTYCEQLLTGQPQAQAMSDQPQ
jgi:hypothetical protein